MKKNLKVQIRELKFVRHFLFDHFEIFPIDPKNIFNQYLELYMKVNDVGAEEPY